MNILFICKYNRFRSKVAETYFNKINKDKNIKVRSAGAIQVDTPLDKLEKQRNIYLKQKYGFVLKARTTPIKVRTLLWADKIIVVADDVPMKLFDSEKWVDKVEAWKVPDEKADNKPNIDKSVSYIIYKVEKLVKKLEMAK